MAIFAALLFAMMMNKIAIFLPIGLSFLSISISCGSFRASEDAYLKSYTKAHTYMVENRPEKAIPYYKRTLKQKANFAQAYHELAVCYQQIGDNDSAIVYYMGAIVFNPRDVDAYQSIGNIYYMERRFDDALIWYDNAAEVNELYPRSYNNMATIWYMRNDYKLARKYYQVAVTVDATYPRAYYGLGLIAFLEGDMEEAEAKFLDAFRVGSMPEAVYMLGQLYYNQKEFKKAETWFKEYLEKEPVGEWSDKARDLLFIISQMDDGPN